MNTKKIFFINLILVIAWLGLLVAFDIYAINLLKAKVWVVILCSLVGVVINYSIALFLHELGHLIFAKKNGLTVNYVNFGLFSIDFTKPSKKVKFFTFWGENAGESVFLPCREMTKAKLQSTAFGGLLFSLIFVVLSVVFVLCIANPVSFCLVSVAILPATYLLVVNCLTFDKTSDGYLIFSSSDYADVLVEIMHQERQIAKGIIPSCPSILEHSTQPLARIYYYKHLVIREKFKRANELLIDLSANILQFTDQEYALIFPEIIYSECLNGNLSEQNKNLAEGFFMDVNNDIATIRAHREYRRFNGDKNWAQTLDKSYQRMLRSSTKFVKEYEKRLKQFSEELN